MKLKKINLRWWIFAYFCAFAFLIILCIFIFQTFFINYFYENIKRKSCYNLADKIEVIINDVADGDTNYVSLLDSLADNAETSVTIAEKNADGAITPVYQSHLETDQIKLRSSDINQRWNKASQSPIDNKVFKEQSEELEYCFISGEYLVILQTKLVPVGAVTKTLRNQFFLITIMTVILAIIFAAYVAKRVSSPISSLNKAAKELAKGNYNTKFNGEGYVEIEELSHSLNYAAEELGKLDSYQKELIANVSHDLRTPLTLITGYSEMMRDIPDEVTLENLQVIIDEAKRLTSLVNDILSLTKMQSGAESFNMENFSLTDTVGEIIFRNNKLLESLGCKIIFEHDENAIVCGDEEKIEKVVYNFISNAINYAGDDKLVIVRQEIKNNKVRLSVIDHGIGIKQEDIKNVWNRYYKNSSAHRRASIGSGLGLSIVKTILDNHNLDYGVISEEGKGSEFWFEMKIVNENL